MHWLRRAHADEEGATAVLVAIGAVVVFGFIALAVDVGHLYAEKRELQNGADAGAIAVAWDCADDDDCTTQATTLAAVDPYATADAYADDNAEDGAAAVANPGGLVIAAPTASDPGKVTVTATSVDASGNGFVTNWFAPVLGMFTGNPDIATTTVQAKAAAIWGSVAFGSLPAELPLTFSQCEYDLFLANGGGHATEPWTEDHNGTPQIIYFHTGAAHSPTPDCAADPVHDSDGDGRLPGGFGWLDTDGTSCQAAIDGEGWVSEDPGASPDHTVCDPAWVKEHIYNQVIILPVYDDVQGLGTNGEYHIYTYAAFYVTGYNFGGSYKEPSPAPCKGELRCIAGWFTTFVADGGEVDPSGTSDVRTVQFVLE